jgi:hypothetical protein
MVMFILLNNVTTDAESVHHFVLTTNGCCMRSYECAMRSFKFIIRGDHDFKIILATPLTP